MEPEKSFLIEASGIVQGVGFRFFVLNPANRFYLNGYVRNIGSGAETLIQGSVQNISGFIAELKKAGFKAVYAQKEIVSERYKNFTIAETVI